MNFTKLLTLCKKKWQGVPNINNGERLTHQVYSILKNLQYKKVSKSPMSKMLRKVDESNKGTNQISVSESENADNTEKLSGTTRKIQITKELKY